MFYYKQNGVYDFLKWRVLELSGKYALWVSVREPINFGLKYMDWLTLTHSAHLPIMNES